MSDIVGVKSFSDLPGPWGIPFFGSLFDLLGKQQGEVLAQWAEYYYGPVFRFQLGSHQFISLQGYEAIGEALVKKSDSFSGRMDAEIIDKLRDGKGVFFNDFGKTWKLWRVFATHSLNAVMETALRGIFTEARYLEAYLCGNFNREIDLSNIMPLFLMNPIFQMCFSTRYDLQVLHDAKVYDQVYGNVADSKFKPLLFLPWLKYLPSFSQFLKKTEQSRIDHMIWLKQLIRERRNRQDNHFVDLVTCFEQNQQEFRDSKSLSEDDFAALIADMLFAGSTTTANQLLWTLLLLFKHPQCMKKVQDELTSVITGKVSTDVFKDLHYTQAVLHETYRLRPIAPTGSVHKTTQDTSVAGFVIPKSTNVITNLWSVHMDKNIWGLDTEMFRPERHLDESGKFHKSKFVIPCSMGSRKCVGEKLADVKILTFLIALLLNYEIRLSDDSKDIDMDGVPGTIWKPKPFKVIVQPKTLTNQNY